MSPGKDDSALSAESALVALESLTKSTLPLRPTSSSRCGRPGNVFNAAAMSRRLEAAMQGSGASKGRVLRIVLAAQGGDAGEVAQHLGLRVGLVFAFPYDLRAAHEITPRQRVLGGNRYDVGLGLIEPPLPIASVQLIVDADQRQIRLRDQPLLDRGVVLDRAVTIEMIRADVGENADRRIEARREIDLIGRAFDHVDIGCSSAARSDRIATPILPPICTS